MNTRRLMLKGLIGGGAIAAWNASAKWKPASAVAADAIVTEEMAQQRRLSEKHSKPLRQPALSAKHQGEAFDAPYKRLGQAPPAFDEPRKPDPTRDKFAVVVGGTLPAGFGLQDPRLIRRATDETKQIMGDNYPGAMYSQFPIRVPSGMYPRQKSFGVRHTAMVGTVDQIVEDFREKLLRSFNCAYLVNEPCSGLRNAVWIDFQNLQTFYACNGIAVGGKLWESPISSAENDNDPRIVEYYRRKKELDDQQAELSKTVAETVKKTVAENAKQDVKQVDVNVALMQISQMVAKLAKAMEIDVSKVNITAQGITPLTDIEVHLVI